MTGIRQDGLTPHEFQNLQNIKKEKGNIKEAKKTPSDGKQVEEIIIATKKLSEEEIEALEER